LKKKFHSRLRLSNPCGVLVQTATARWCWPLPMQHVAHRFLSVFFPFFFECWVVYLFLLLFSVIYWTGIEWWRQRIAEACDWTILFSGCSLLVPCFFIIILIINNRKYCLFIDYYFNSINLLKIVTTEAGSSGSGSWPGSWPRQGRWLVPQSRFELWGRSQWNRKSYKKNNISTSSNMQIDRRCFLLLQSGEYGHNVPSSPLSEKRGTSILHINIYLCQKLTLVNYPVSLSNQTNSLILISIFH